MRGFYLKRGRAIAYYIKAVRLQEMKFDYCERPKLSI